jgi:hypothetical protein
MHSVMIMLPTLQVNFTGHQNIHYLGLNYEKGLKGSLGLMWIIQDIL